MGAVAGAHAGPTATETPSRAVHAHRCRRRGREPARRARQRARGALCPDPGGGRCARATRGARP